MLFLALMPTLMVPYQVTLIPTFILFSKLGWVGTHLPLWVPAFWGGAFGTFLMRQFFTGDHPHRPGRVRAHGRGQHRAHLPPHLRAAGQARAGHAGHLHLHVVVE
ncbi:MAG: hypothetical protein R2838_00295 [Caldilineaceae bacterium]